MSKLTPRTCNTLSISISIVIAEGDSVLSPHVHSVPYVRYRRSNHARLIRLSTRELHASNELLPDHHTPPHCTLTSSSLLHYALDHTEKSHNILQLCSKHARPQPHRFTRGETCRPGVCDTIARHKIPQTPSYLTITLPSLSSKISASSFCSRGLICLLGWVSRALGNHVDSLYCPTCGHKSAALRLHVRLM